MTENEKTQWPDASGAAEALVILPQEELENHLAPEMQIARFRDHYLSVTIKAWDDKENIELAKTGRQLATGAIGTLEARRKALKEPALEYGRRIDATAKELDASLREVKDHLSSQLDYAKAEKARIKEAHERAIKEKLDARMAKLQALNCTLAVSEVEALDDQDFELALLKAESAFQEAQERKAKEAAQAAAERAKAEEAARLELEQAQEAARKAAQKAHYEAEARKAAEEELQALKAAAALKEAESKAIDDMLLDPDPMVITPKRAVQVHPAPQEDSDPDLDAWMAAGFGAALDALLDASESCPLPALRALLAGKILGLKQTIAHYGPHHG